MKVGAGETEREIALRCRVDLLWNYVIRELLSIVTSIATVVRRSESISLDNRWDFAKKGRVISRRRHETKEIAQSSEERCCGLSIIVTITIIFLIIMRIIINDNYC